MILIIDDEIDVRRVTMHMIQRMGFTTLEAVDGQQGITLFQSYGSEISCVLLDLTMPRTNGAEVLQVLRSIHMHTPIIMMSGYSESEMSTRLHATPPDGFLQKPFTLNDIRVALQRVVNLPQ